MSTAHALLPQLHSLRRVEPLLKHCVEGAPPAEHRVAAEQHHILTNLTEMEIDSLTDVSVLFDALLSGSEYVSVEAAVGFTKSKIMAMQHGELMVLSGGWTTSTGGHAIMHVI